MSNPNSFEEIFSSIICDYFDTYPAASPVIPDYHIVEDIASAYLSLRPDILEKSSSSVESLSAYNGFAVPPNEIGGTFTVLINKNVLMENVQNKRTDWIGTIAHETTHVQDFAEFAQIVGAKKYDEILEISCHGMFNLWTEVHARSRGYYFTRKYALGLDNISSKEMLPDILEREIPAQQDRLFEQYHSTTNGFEQAYLVAQYIGRLFTLQELYPNDLTNDWIIDHFGVNMWMADWFFFFKEHRILSAAAEHFEDMKDILRQNFCGI